MDIIIHTERISRCVEREYIRRFGSRRIFNRIKKRIWRRRWGGGKSDRVKEIRTRRENNGGICIGVQKGREMKWVWGKVIDRGAQEGDVQDDQEEVDGGRKASNKHRIVVWACH